VSAGLLTRTFVSVVRVDPGFRADSRLTFRVAIPPREGGRDAFNLFASEFERRIAALPGVRGVGAISHVPYDDLPNWALNVGTARPLDTEVPAADARAVSPALLDTLEARLVDGRHFTEADADVGNPVAIVDERLARRLWPDRAAVGQRLVTTTPGLSAPVDGPTAVFTVVGVIRHVNLRNLVDDLNPQVFVPWRIAQRNPAAFVVHTTGDASALVPAVQAALREMDPRVAIYDARPLADYVTGARATRQFTMVLAAIFAVSALLLTAVGVYGVLAYAAAQRRQEISVRRALGADARQLVVGVVREALRFALVGGVIGLLAARAVATLLAGQLHGVNGIDVATTAAAMGLIVAATLAACAIPAYRVLRVSPTESLRAE
jgi:putative ABC transport system permease protein